MRAAALICALLCSCAGGGSTSSVPAEPSPADLCVASSCGTKTQLLTIEQAEAILFTPEGRMFVSGSTNVFEITKPGDGYQGAPIYSGTCNFTGMVQRGDVLYVACEDGNLYAAQLTDHPQLKQIHALNMNGPNGVATGPDGEIYITNGPLSSSGPPDPRIVRLRFDANDPMHVTEQVNWLTSGISFPNGINCVGHTLFFTDSTAAPPTLGMIKRVDISADGAPGAVQVIASFNSIPDDMGVVGDSLLVALYTEGSIALIKQDGTLISQTDPASFQFPSDAKLARSPMFGATDIVVTEKGIVGDTVTPIGDKLSVFRRTSH